jgi:hypothetical protein
MAVSPKNHIKHISKLHGQKVVLAYIYIYIYIYIYVYRVIILSGIYRLLFPVMLVYSTDLVHSANQSHTR